MPRSRAARTNPVWDRPRRSRASATGTPGPPTTTSAQTVHHPDPSFGIARRPLPSKSRAGATDRQRGSTDQGVCRPTQLPHAGGMPASSRGSKRSADPRAARQPTDPGRGRTNRRGRRSQPLPRDSTVDQHSVSGWPNNSRPFNARTRTFAPCRGRTRLPPYRGFAAVLRTAPAPTAIGYGRPLRGRNADATGAGPEARFIEQNEQRHAHHRAAPGTGAKGPSHTSLGQRPRNNAPQGTLKG